ITEKNADYKNHKYDSLGNCYIENGPHLVFNDHNQLRSTPETFYSYDPQGNLLRKTLDGEETQFKYNALSELIAIEKPNTNYVTFSYDPFGRRISKKVYESQDKKKLLNVTRSFYIGDYELGHLNEYKKITKLRIPGSIDKGCPSKSVAIEIDQKLYVVLHDIFGNVCALVDPSTKQIVESYQYTAFG